jgi:hypothetical protein
MMIMRNEDRTCGRLKITLVKTGQNLEKEPAGRRYAIVFFKLSKTTRPACTTAEKDSSSTSVVDSFQKSLPVRFRLI